MAIQFVWTNVYNLWGIWVLRSKFQRIKTCVCDFCGRYLITIPFLNDLPKRPMCWLMAPWHSVVLCHDDVIKWKYFPRYWPFVRGTTGHRWIPLTKANDAELWCFFYLRLNKGLSKQSRHWWFETPSRSLWRHCNVLWCDVMWLLIANNTGTPSITDMIS